MSTLEAFLLGLGLGLFSMTILYTKFLVDLQKEYKDLYNQLRQEVEKL